MRAAREAAAQDRLEQHVAELRAARTSGGPSGPHAGTGAARAARKRGREGQAAPVRQTRPRHDGGGAGCRADSESEESDCSG